MAEASCSDAEFIRLFNTYGGAETARRLGVLERTVFRRRRNIEGRRDTRLSSPQDQVTQHPGRIGMDIQNGVVLVGSDAHIWPGDDPLALRAFVKFAKELKPAAVILNGDVMDLPRPSRHAPLGWEKQPEVRDELEAVQDKLHIIEQAAGKAYKIWTFGNHDSRYEAFLAQHASDYRGIKGMHLKDHFPLWEPCWSAWINNDVVVKHRFPRGGIHATTNNPLWAGKTTVQGHLHSAQVRPITDYNGTRYGVDTGSLANTSGPQFEYLEDGYRNWRSGFGVLTFHKGHLLQPELVLAFDSDHVEFRGQLIKV